MLRVVFTPEAIAVFVFILMLVAFGVFLYFKEYDDCMNNYIQYQSLPEDELEYYNNMCHQEALQRMFPNQ